MKRKVTIEFTVDCGEGYLDTETDLLVEDMFENYEQKHGVVFKVVKDERL